MILTHSLLGAPPNVPSVPTIEAATLAQQTAPNAQAWRKQAEQVDDLRKENRLLREEIDRLKHAEQAVKQRERSTKAIRRTAGGNSGKRVDTDSPAPTADRYVVTAYTNGVESTGKTPAHPEYGITASGKAVQAGVTVACAPELPFGTRVEIEGVGIRTCYDRGSRITSGHLDVYMPELADAREFGRQTLRVRVLD